MLTAGCARCGRSSDTVARFDGGKITNAEFQTEANRLPPALREQFETPGGRRELLAAMVDKRLLAAEAKRRGITDEPDLRRQVEEFEERLVVQALLQREEQAAAPFTEQEAREWFAQHAKDFAQPERARVRRIVALWGPSGPTAGRDAARARLERLSARLARGGTFEAVAVDGEGPERLRRGDMGILMRGGGGDPELERVAFGLPSPGAISPPFACRDGLAIVQLVERLAPHEPTFDEVRSDVTNRMEPLRKRRVLDALLKRLRAGADVRIELRGDKP
jgi:peptidyl-prolyl cis-trans isomerase C